MESIVEDYWKKFEWFVTRIESIICIFWYYFFFVISFDFGRDFPILTAKETLAWS